MDRVLAKNWKRIADLRAAVGKHSKSFSKNSELLFIALHWHPAFKSQQRSSDTAYTSPRSSKKWRPPVFSWIAASIVLNMSGLFFNYFSRKKDKT